MFDASVQWLCYLSSASICLWAWDRMFFFVSNGQIRILLRVLGLVLLFTPMPTDVSANEYSPAFIVVLFRAFLENDPNYFDGIVWMLVALFLSLLLLSLLSLLKLLLQKTPARSVHSH